MIKLNQNITIFVALMLIFTSSFIKSENNNLNLLKNESEFKVLKFLNWDEEANYAKEESERGVQYDLSALNDNLIHVENCMKDSKFFIFKLSVNPSQIQKGVDFKLKVSGLMKAEVDVKNVHIDVTFNGEALTALDIPKETHLKVQKWSFEVENSVPTFIPSGKYDNMIYLVSANGEKLACVHASFEI